MFSDGANSTGLAALRRTASDNVPTLTNLLPQAQHKAIFLHQIEPLLDCANPHAVNQLLEQAETVIALTSFKSPHLMTHADVLLPIASLGETSGTTVNMFSELQSFTGCVSPLGEARPAWKVLRVLANLLNIDGITYTSSQDVLEEIKTKVNFSTKPKITAEALVSTITSIPAENAALQVTDLYRITQWPLYRVDTLVRRATALQECGSATQAGVYMNQHTCDQLKLTANQTVSVQQGGRATLPVMIENNLPNDAIFIPAGFNETSLLGENFGKVGLSMLG